MGQLSIGEIDGVEICILCNTNLVDESEVIERQGCICLECINKIEQEEVNKSKYGKTKI